MYMRQKIHIAFMTVIYAGMYKTVTLLQQDARHSFSMNGRISSTWSGVVFLCLLDAFLISFYITYIYHICLNKHWYYISNIKMQMASENTSSAKQTR